MEKIDEKTRKVNNTEKAKNALSMPYISVIHYSYQSCIYSRNTRIRKRKGA